MSKNPTPQRRIFGFQLIKKPAPRFSRFAGGKSRWENHPRALAGIPSIFSRSSAKSITLQRAGGSPRKKRTTFAVAFHSNGASGRRDSRHLETT